MSALDGEGHLYDDGDVAGVPVRGVHHGLVQQHALYRGPAH